MISGTGEGLVFLLGLPRSGTTLLSVLLDQHPEISCPPEPWIALALDAIGLVPMGHPADARVIGRATQEFFQGDHEHDPRIDSIRSFASTAYSSRLDGASILVDKTPRYWYILDQLESWFPDARYIYLRRDPFDVVASYLSTWGIDLAREIQSASPNIQSLDLTVGLRRIEDFVKKHDDRVYTLSYESLVEDPKQVIKEAFRWLNVSKLKGLIDGDGHIPQEGLKRVTASTLGDKNILKLDSISTKSVGAGFRTLSEDQLRVIYDTIGKKALVDMGYGKTAEELLNRGLKAPTKSKSTAIRKASEEMVASRWSRCRSWADLGVELPPEVAGLVHNAHQQAEMATAARMSAEGEYGRVLGELEALRAQHEELQSQHEQLEAQRAGAVQETEEAIEEQIRLKGEIQSLSDQHESDLETQSQLQSRIEELDLTRSELEAQIQVVKEQLAQSKQDIEDLEVRSQEEKESLESKIRFLDNELTRVIDSADQSRERLTKGFEKHIQEQQELQQQQISAYESRIDQLNAEAIERDQRAHQREHELGSEFERVLAAYNMLDAVQRKKFFGPIGHWSRIVARSKLLGERAIARMGPRPHKGWPRITIVTPCFNAQWTIRETIESVLGQCYPNLQYIIVDGGSTDGTLDIIEEYRDKLDLVISEPDNGMYDAVQKGFQHTTGEVMGYLNADDTFEPGGLWRIADLFRSRNDIMVAYHEDTINTKGWRTPNAHQPKGVHFYDLLYGKHILFQDGVWWRKHAYDTVHGIDSRLKYAGDYDLWLRMSMHFRFYRAPGHVSCFRKQAGQLSENMEQYWAEVEQSKQWLRESIGWPQIIRRFPRWIRCKTAALFERKPRLFFPLNPGFGIPDAEVRPINPSFPRCGLTNRPPDRLMFSTMDTRFGHTLLSRVWRCEESDTAMMDPHLDQDELDHLYATYYSVWQTEPYPPADGVESPYVGYRGPALLPRLAQRFVFPAKVASRLNRRKLKHWVDVSYDELIWMLKGSADPEDDSVRFLDIGCFNGDLLDRLAKHTNWITCGSETNPEAVATARGKGHEVYEGAAEELWHKIPESVQFDVIYLGQVIEHINDPYAFVRRIKTVLKPGGTLIMTTPNLDSAQLDLYGPTWSHWHAPFHRVMFGRRGLKLLGERSGFKLTKMRSSSDPGWTLLSQKLNTFGLAGAVPHDYSYTPEEHHRACSLAAWSRLLWDWRNRGDYLLTAFRAE